MNPDTKDQSMHNKINPDKQEEILSGRVSDMQQLNKKQNQAKEIK